jgi:PAS domain S-box-containing protein
MPTRRKPARPPNNPSIPRVLANVVRHRIGRRGAFLTFLGVLDVVYAYGLAFPGAAGSSAGMRYLDSIAPLWCWASFWASTGILCLAYAFARKDAVAYGAAMFLKVVWASTYFIGWAIAGLDRGYLSTVVWGGFAFVVALIGGWPETPAVRGDVWTPTPSSAKHPDEDRMPDAIITSDLDGRITGWMGGAEHMFGWPAAEIVGRPLTVLMPARYHQAHQAGLDRFRQTGRSVLAGRMVELHAVDRDGTEFPVQLLIGGHLDGDGRQAFSAVARAMRRHT